MDIVYLDVETTGLDSDRHTIFEIGMIYPDGRERTYWIPLTDEERGAADSGAMVVNNYNLRCRSLDTNGSYSSNCSSNWRRVTRRSTLAQMLAEETHGCILAGCTVKFDQIFLDKWMRQHGAAPSWDYHVLDIQTYAAGYLAAKSQPVPLPFSTSKLAKALNVPQPEGEDKHTALADARWGKRLFEACS